MSDKQGSMQHGARPRWHREPCCPLYLRDSTRVKPAICPFGGRRTGCNASLQQNRLRQSFCLSVQPSAVLRLSPDTAEYTVT
jgi:hypothetical protein